MRLPRCSIRPEIRAIYEELNQLTRETNKEYGLFVCKKGSEITSGLMCIGDECSIKLNLKRDGCPVGYEVEEFVHTHPRTGDNFSTEDVSWAGAYDVDKLCVVSPVTDGVTCLENLVRIHAYGRLLKDDFVDRHRNLLEKVIKPFPEERMLMLSFDDTELNKKELAQVDKARKKMWTEYHNSVGRLTDNFPKKAQVKVCTEKVK